MCSIGDSLDLVPIAAFHGRGKRTGKHSMLFLHIFIYVYCAACLQCFFEENKLITSLSQGFMVLFFLLAMMNKMKNIKVYAVSVSELLHA